MKIMAKLAPTTQASKTAGYELATASPCNSSIKDCTGCGFATVDTAGAERVLAAASWDAKAPHRR